jgi:PAS domain S-box-containing protein
MVKVRTVGNLSTSTTPEVEELKRSVERLQALMDEIPAGIMNVDLKGKITYVNKTILQSTGYSRDELVGKSAFRLGLIPRETLKLLRGRMKEKLMGKPPSPLEIKFKRRDGTWMWVEMTGKAFWEHGVHAGVQIVGRDVTERKQAEEALQQSEERLKTYIESAPDGVYINDLKGTFLYGNRKAEEIIGHKKEELLGKSFLKLNILPAKYLAKAGKLLALNTIGKPTGPDEFELIKKDGSRTWVEITTTPVKRAGGKTEVIGFVRDITKRKRAEEALRGSEERYKELAGSITDVFFALDKDLRYTYWNKASEELTGISAENALGKHLYDIFPDSEMTRSAEKVYLKVLRTQQAQSFVNEYQLGGKDYFFEISAYPSKNGLSVFVRDITERKQMEEELRAAHEQLIRSERLAAIGQLAGGVGHELRNPLGAIKNAVYYIKGKVASSELGQREPRVMEFLGIIDDEVNSSSKIITDLLGFSRVGKPSVSPAKIEKIIEDALSHIAIPENIELIKKLDAGLPEINVDPDQIKQVLVNIITNAVEAMLEGGRLLIAAREKDKFLEVEVTDTGCGIPQESMDKIFDPLFTTKAKGIGLGLPVCKAIIDRHEGNIAVKSKVGEGTTFNIKLPLGRNIGGN